MFICRKKSFSFFIQLQIYITKKIKYGRRLDPSVLAFSVSLYRHPFICILFSSRFTPYNKINKIIRTDTVTLSNLSTINLVSIFRSSSPPCNPVYPRCVDPSALAFSLSSHRRRFETQVVQMVLLSLMVL
jgi:hypothetical protein